MKMAFCNANLVNVAAGEPRPAAQPFDLPRAEPTASASMSAAGFSTASVLSPRTSTARISSRRCFAGRARRSRCASLLLGGAKPGVSRDRAAGEPDATAIPRHRCQRGRRPRLFRRSRRGTPPSRRSEGGAAPSCCWWRWAIRCQERFIADKLGPQHCSVAAGVGALFDFFADEVQRAPEFVASRHGSNGYSAFGCEPAPALAALCARKSALSSCGIARQYARPDGRRSPR